MRAIKFIITLFFITMSYWVTCLVFQRNFKHAGMAFSADDWTENTLMILLTSTFISMAGVLCIGVLSMFTHFVFIKLIYADEIKQAAFFYIKNRNKDTNISKQYIKQFEKYERSKLTFKQKFLKILSKVTNG